MIITAPYRNHSDCRLFIADLMSMMKPEVVYISYPDALTDINYLHTTYRKILKGVEIVGGSISDNLERIKADDRNVLVLCEYEALKRLCVKHEEAREFMAEYILYPSDSEIRVNINELRNYVLGRK